MIILLMWPKLFVMKFINLLDLKLAQTIRRQRVLWGFPALITALCAKHGMEVNPYVKIRPPIDVKFIVNNCTSAEEQSSQV